MSRKGRDQSPSQSQEPAVLPRRWTYSCIGAVKNSRVTKEEAVAVREMEERLCCIFRGGARCQHGLGLLSGHPSFPL